MPLLANPEFRHFLADQWQEPSARLRSMGMVAPTRPDVMRLPGTEGSNLTYRMGEGLGSFLQDKKFLEPAGKYFGALGSSKGPGMAALLSAIMGGVAGGGFGLATNRDPVMWGLLGAGAGGLGGLGINQLLQARDARRRRKSGAMMKYSFYVGNEQDPLQYIQQRMFEDGSTSTDQKVQIVQQLRNIPRQELMTLSDLLRTATGGMVGYIIARFLMRFGGIGTAVMTGLGGLIGASTGGRKLPRNMFGLEVDTSRDMFGQPRFVS